MFEAESQPRSLLSRHVDTESDFANIRSNKLDNFVRFCLKILTIRGHLLTLQVIAITRGYFSWYKIPITNKSGDLMKTMLKATVGSITFGLMALVAAQVSEEGNDLCAP